MRLWIFNLINKVEVDITNRSRVHEKTRTFLKVYMKYHGLVGTSPDVMWSSGNLRLATTDVRVPEKKIYSRLYTNSYYNIIYRSNLSLRNSLLEWRLPWPSLLPVIFPERFRKPRLTLDNRCSRWFVKVQWRMSRSPEWWRKFYWNCVVHCARHGLRTSLLQRFSAQWFLCVPPVLTFPKQFCVHLTKCGYVICIDRTTNSDHFLQSINSFV